MIAAVLDTNVVLSSQKSKGTGSPNAEVIKRWEAGEFDWLFTNDVLEEYAEKLTEHGIADQTIQSLLGRLIFAGVEVEIDFFHLRHYPIDSDDTAFLLAALNGNASHLVTYDRDLEDVAVFYPEFVTCKPLVFLTHLRAASPP
ncbi:putative toxin-antitoxin system toxin component, PIN family [Prosthecobacter sp.]|uniref:putative toxin-antitoxin system toxin component, PIN family n=1 Tax=Prosthecobacter sp. TaxID=1965333 RepID=UPI003784FCD5